MSAILWIRTSGSATAAMLLFVSAMANIRVSAQQTAPAGQDSQTKPTLDCAVFSLEGIRPGMTIGEVKALGIEVKERHAFVPPEMKGRLFRFRGEKHDGNLTLDEGGTLKQMSVDFIKRGFLSVRADVDYDALVKVLAERWGEPVSNDSSTDDLHNAFNAVIGQQIIRKSGWESRECRRVATVLYLKRTGPSVLLESITVTLARDITLEELEAAAEEREKAERDAREKIKF